MTLTHKNGSHNIKCIIGITAQHNGTADIKSWYNRLGGRSCFCLNVEDILPVQTLYRSAMMLTDPRD
jgi:hypothetical protein